MTGKDDDLSYVVVTYNGRNLIARCLESVLDQEESSPEIIVIDNASTDGTVAYIEAAFPQVQLVANAENEGYPAGCNRGVALASRDVVAILNQDVRLESGWSHAAKAVLSNEPSCGAVEGKLLLEGRGDVLNCKGSYVNLLGFGCARGFGEKDSSLVETRPVSYPSGAAFVVRREAFDQVEGFDGSYFLYHDDVDLGLRLWGAGWSVLYTSEAVASHDFQSGLKREKVRRLEENRWKTLLKNMAPGYFARCAPLLVVSELGLLFYLATSGYLGAKLQAVHGFLRKLGHVMAARRENSSRGRLLDPEQVMTPDFPSLLPSDGRSTQLARKLMRGYWQSILPGASRLPPESVPRSADGNLHLSS